MYNVQDHNVLYNNADRPVICEGSECECQCVADSSVEHCLHFSDFLSVIVLFVLQFTHATI
jgi:hypothetical protein